MRTVFIFLAIFYSSPTVAAQITIQDFGQQKSDIPKDSSLLFGNDIISTHRNEYNLTIAPEGDMILFTVANNSSANRYYTIFLCEKKNGNWQTPQIAPFSGQYSDADPFFSPNGDGVYFISTRPTTENAVKSDFDIWTVGYKNGKFGEPKHLGTTVNTTNDELYPSVSRTGDLFFSTENGVNGYDLMVSKIENNTFQLPSALADSINTEATEFDAFVAPDESYIIYTNMGGKDNLGSGDLYISFNKGDYWTKGKNLGEKVNTIHMEQCPTVSSSGQFLFFTSFRDNQQYAFDSPVSTGEYLKLLDSPLNGLGDIFCIELNALLKEIKFQY
ncbi:TolB family protein [Algoriphagus terrigena]|uniref:TolB family protein n=1 Tax=Algoriphagus terrigena TaxID=344884 RepID=UPI0004280F78|nr:PD40 domain-containing protein [Algoriphagus terrigena]